MNTEYGSENSVVNTVNQKKTIAKLTYMYMYMQSISTITSHISREPENVCIIHQQ